MRSLLGTVGVCDRVATEILQLVDVKIWGVIGYWFLRKAIAKNVLALITNFVNGRLEISRLDSILIITISCDFFYKT
jgi:hypothetical protein